MRIARFFKDMFAAREQGPSLTNKEYLGTARAKWDGAAVPMVRDVDGNGFEDFKIITAPAPSIYLTDVQDAIAACSGTVQVVSQRTGPGAITLNAPGGSPFEGSCFASYITWSFPTTGALPALITVTFGYTISGGTAKTAEYVIRPQSYAGGGLFVLGEFSAATKLPVIHLAEFGWAGNPLTAQNITATITGGPAGGEYTAALLTRGSTFWRLYINGLVQE